MTKAFNHFCVMLYCSMQSFVKEEKGAVDIVAIVVMIGIAVLMAVLFKDKIGSLLNTLFGNITTNATAATEGAM